SYQGVNGFFLASGLGLTVSMLYRPSTGSSVKFWIRWLVRRLIRLIPLYWFALLVAFICYISGLRIFAVIVNTDKPFLDFILHFFFLHIFSNSTYFSINIAWWFIGVIFFFYLIFPIVYRVIDNQKSKSVAFAVLVVISILLGRAGLLPNQVVESIIFFLIGIYAALMAGYIITSPGALFYAFIFVLSSLYTIAIFYFAVHLRTSVFIYKLQILIVLAPYVFVLTFLSLSLFLSSINARPLLIISSILKRFSQQSYAIFLIHWALIYPVFFLFSSFALAIIVYFFLIVFLSLLLTRADMAVSGILTRKSGLF
ncbi:MAG: acyltransferase, partial [Thermodesulfobacteriota bacterium]